MAAQATVKLYASLMSYLPPGAKDQAVRVSINDNATIGGTLASMNVPKERCHLVLLNGIFVPPSQRADKNLQDGDTLAVWPPVAGG